MKPAKTQQLLNMPTPLWVYVEDLRQTGLYGTSVAAVIRTLVMRGVQDAITQRFIKLRAFAEVEDSEQ